MKNIPFLLPSTIFVLLFSPFRLATLHMPSFYIHEFCEYKSPQNKQNNWKINHHSTPLRKGHNASDQVLTYWYFKSVCIDFRSLITTSTRISLWFRCVMICIFPRALDTHLIRSNRVKKYLYIVDLIPSNKNKSFHFCK